MVLDVNLLLDITLMLLGAKVLGEISERLGFSSLIGEVIAGLILGPILLIIKPNAFLDQIAGFGILFLLFLIGLNTRFDDIKKDSYKGSVLAIIGCGLTFVAGLMVGVFLLNDLNIGIFLGIAMISTSTAITLRSLIDIGEMKTRVYELSLAIDMADEVIAILSLSILTTYFTYGTVQIWTVAILFFTVLGFFLLIMTAGSKIVNRFLELFTMLKDEQILVSIPLVIVFTVAFLSEQVGIASVTGAFLAGMAMNRSKLAENVIIPKMKIIGYGYFIPLFFAYSAVIFDLSALVNQWGLILLLLLLGSLAKVIGCGYCARFYRFGKREQMLTGLGMIPRGEYTIVISQIALALAIINAQLYTVMISYAILSIIITPVLLKLAAKQRGF